MKDMLTKGVCARIVLYIVRLAQAAYGESRLKRVANAVSACFKQSCTHRALSAYVHKQPYFRSSLVYRLVCFIAAIVDGIFGAVHRVLAPCIKGSAVYAFVLRIRALGSGNIAYLAGVLLMSIPIGSIISMIYVGKVTSANMAMCWAVFILGMVVVFCGICSSAVKNSFVVRALCRLADIILG